MKRNVIIKSTGIVFYLVFLSISFKFDFAPGKEIGTTFFYFLIDMLKILPFSFILIGLFEVWIKRSTVEKHLGDKSGVKGYFWAILLAGTTIGGLFVSLPIAYSLCRKGAKLSIVFTYLGASAIARIPMTVFEASFVGLKFTIIRLSISLPLVILTSIALGNYLTKNSYSIQMPDKLK